jgi:hypothetical protein
MLIDWSKPESKIGKYFTVKEALFLPSWGVLHIPNDIEKAAILRMAEKMDVIREYLERPIHVTCWIRPKVVNCPNHPGYNGKNYNAAVGGAFKSAHIEGIAVDFTVSAITASDVRFLLKDKLEEFQIRMENHHGNWTHVDLRDVPPGGSRYFKPQ